MINFPRKIIPVGDCYAVAKRKRFTGEETEEPMNEGRPQLEFEGEWWKAPRLSYSLNVSPIPCAPPSRKEGLVLHSCDNGWCVNPAHLSIGTAKRNMQEKWERCPGIRDRRSALSKAQWQKPEYRAKNLEARK